MCGSPLRPDEVTEALLALADFADVDKRDACKQAKEDWCEHLGF